MSKTNTKPNQNQLPIEIQFSGKELTNHAGILPLYQFCKTLNLASLLDQRIQLALAPNTVYPTSQIILATVLGLLAGHKRINQIETFSQDPLVKRLLNISNKLDEDTIKRRFARFGMQSNTQFSDLIGHLSQTLHKRLQTKEDILDLDSSVRTVYGNQEGAAKGYNPEKRGAKSYHPLFAFLNSTKECLRFYLRPGNTSSNNNVCGLVHECMGTLPASLNSLFVRADSGFFDGLLLSLLEEYNRKERKVTYVVKVKLRGLDEILSWQDWKPILEKPGWECTEFDYRCSGWDHYRRFVGVRRLKQDSPTDTLFPIPEYDSFCYVTNSPGAPFLIHEFYGDRGESENWIEAVKHQLFGGCMLTKEFWTNEALWLCSVLGYNLSVWFRKVTDAQVWREEPQTFRYWFINLAGKIVRHGRKYILKLYSQFHHKHRWYNIYELGKRLDFG